MKNHIYEYDKIVIGGTMSALAYAYNKQVPAIFCKPSPPLIFEHYEPTDNLEKFGITSRETVLTSPDGKEIVGNPKAQVWQKLSFVMSLAGLLPLSSRATSISVGDDNILSIATERARVVKFKFNELIVFDKENLQGFTHTPEEILRYKVIDWINVKSGTKHEYDFIKTKDDFVSRIYFYDSSRVFGKGRKDAAAVSYLTAEQLDSYEYSDTYVKYKVAQIMSDSGIRGAKNGKCSKTGNVKHTSIKIEPSRRQVIPIVKLSDSDHPNITIASDNKYNLLPETAGPNGYLWRLIQQIR
tara:strand:+ start:103 stop:996 length:894 start_codon:yes stop_codon:yes gene_type:complete